jgi:nicotinate dehydrogenase subunit A
MTDTYEVTVNGEPRTLHGPPDTALLNALRAQLGLKGSRFGCGSGLCGACVVLVDGRPTPSCDLPLWSAAGRRVTTVEGLATTVEGLAGESLHPVQEAFLTEQAAQCGYCISGILVSAAALLAENPHPDEPAVVAALDRHLCRCGVHGRVVRAVLGAGGGPRHHDGDGGAGGGLPRRRDGDDPAAA